MVGGEPVILVERTDGNVQAAIRSLDEIPVPGPVQVFESASASDLPVNTEPQRVQQTSAKEKATPTPTPKKATPTPTPKKK